MSSDMRRSFSPTPYAMRETGTPYRSSGEPFDGNAILRFRKRFAERMQRQNGRIALLHRFFEFQAEAGNALGIGKIGLRPVYQNWQPKPRR